MSRRARLTVLLLFLLKLALVAPLPRTAVGSAKYDDRLLVELGTSLASGEWLGSYDIRTLAKGTGYPLFLAASQRLGIPLHVSEQLLYGLFCLIVMIALAPALRGEGGRLALFALLLFQPASFSMDALAYVTRSAIYTPQVGLCLILAAGLGLRMEQPPVRLLGWSVALGLLLGWTWITREEGVWLVPALGLLLAWPLCRCCLGRPAGWIWRTAALVLPSAIAVGIVSSVAAINAAHYGRFLTIELKDPAFKAAYGALTRVKPQVALRTVPVSRETRARIYPVSPAFEELRPWLEGEIGRAWALLSPRVDGEIHGAFVWALREAVAAAGHAHSSTEAHDFYALLAHEVNTACDDGRLDAWPRRDGLFPRGQEDLPARMLRALRPAWRRFVSFRMVDPEIHASSGTEPELAAFAALSRSRLASTTEPLTPANSTPLRFIGWIAAPYRWLGAAWTYSALVLFGFLSLAAAFRRFAPRLWLLEVVLLLSVALRFGLLALISATSFNGLVSTYVSCVYPELLLFDGLVTLEAIRFAREFRARWLPSADGSGNSLCSATRSV